MFKGWGKVSGSVPSILGPINTISQNIEQRKNGTETMPRLNEERMGDKLLRSSMAKSCASTGSGQKAALPPTQDTSTNVHPAPNGGVSRLTRRVARLLMNWESQFARFPPLSLCHARVKSALHFSPIALAAGFIQYSTNQ